MRNNSNRDEPILIMSLAFGFNLVKRIGNEPQFEIWQGTGSKRDLLHIFNAITDTAKFLVESGYCSDLENAYKALNKGGQND